VGALTSRERLRSAATGASHGADLAAVAAAAEQQVASVRFEAADVNAVGHGQRLEDRARFGIDPPQLALVTLPGTVPELAVDPGDAGDEAIGFDRAQDRAGLRIDLMDLALLILRDPERPFGPGEPRRVTRRRRGDRRQDRAGGGIDLLDAVGRQLIQVASAATSSRRPAAPVSGSNDCK
jgi:hypothetical protein